MVEEFTKAVTILLSRFVEAAAAVVIAVAALRAFIGFLIVAVRPRGGSVPKEEIRLSLARSLALALEFELGADILRTAVAPSWNDVGLLAAIAALRTALNYFLGRELSSAAQTAPVEG